MLRKIVLWGYDQLPAVQPEVELIAFEVSEDIGQKQAPLDLALEFMLGDLALVNDIDVIPTGELAHRGLEAGMVELEIPILPGDDLLYVDIGGDAELAGFVEGRLLGGFEEGALVVAG